MKNLLKLFVSVVVISLNIYCSIVFGLSVWTIVVLAAGGVIFASLFVGKLDYLACLLSRLVGVSSAVAAVLLLLAGTIGGSFHLSESNEIILVGLLFLSFFGCALFLYKITPVKVQ